MKPVLTTLCLVLHELATALESGRDTDVLAVETRLAEVVAEARAQALTVRAGSMPLDDLRDHIATVRDQLACCRRLGATVPALLSVMFPGQIGYGPSVARHTQAPVRSSLAQVI